jgi:hypothetical protein
MTGGIPYSVAKAPAATVPFAMIRPDRRAASAAFDAAGTREYPPNSIHLPAARHFRMAPITTIAIDAALHEIRTRKSHG